MLDFLECNPITIVQAPEKEFGDSTDFCIPGIFDSSQLPDIRCLLFPNDFPPLQESGPDSLYTISQPFSSFNFELNPPKFLSLSSSDTNITPIGEHDHSPGSLHIITSPPRETEEIIDPSFPGSIPGTYRFDHHSGGQSTERVDSDATPKLSLHEQFADIMDIVRRLPSGEKPKNTLFTPFFTRRGDLYVCLLCPTKTRKALVNRTQMIQHIAGGHGENRPFACLCCPYRAIRKADLQKHKKEVHSSSRWYCSKCSKAFANKRNTRRHEKFCSISN